MGLREKVALVITFSISTQILCTQCMPRSQLNFTSNTKHIKLPEICGNDKPNKTKPPREEALNLAATKDSVIVCFPDVEYLSSSQPGEYYRFQNDYPFEFPPDSMNNSSSQARNYERGLKSKRKYEASIKAKKPQGTSIMEYDSLSQPHYLSDSSLFPEVEYPLSARDMWLPNHWTPLQGANRNSQREIDIAVSRNSVKGTQLSNYDPNYENSNLNNLIKGLNTEKNSGLRMLNSEMNTKVPLSKESAGLRNETYLNTTSSINSDVNPELSTPKKNSCYGNIISTPTIMTNNDINLVTSVPMNESPVDIGTINNVLTNVKNGDINPELGISQDNQDLRNSIIPIMSTPVNIDVNSELSNSIENSLGDMVRIIVKTISTDDINPELLIPNENHGSYDETIPEQCKKNTFVDSTHIDTTTTNTSDIISQHFISEENQDSHDDNNVPTITTAASYKIIPDASKTGSLDDYGDIVIMTTNTDTSDIISQLSIPKENEGSCDNIVPKATTATNSDIIPVPLKISSLYDCGDIVTKTTNTDTNNIISPLPITEENQGSRNVHIISTTATATNSNIIPDSLETSSHNDCGDIVTITTNSEISDIMSHLSMSKANESFCDNNVTKATTESNTDIIPELFKSRSLDDYRDMIATITNTDTNDIIFQPPIPEKSQGCHDNIISTTTTATNSDITRKPFETSSLSDCGDIVITVTHTDNSDISQLSSTKENQGSRENIVLTTTTPANSDPELSSTNTDANPILTTPLPFTCVGNEKPPKPNNYIGALIEGKDFTQNLFDIDKNHITKDEMVNFTASNTETDEKNNPQELPKVAQDNYPLLNNNIVMKTTPENQINENNSIFSSGLNEVTDKQGESIVSSNIKTENEQLSENSNDVSPVMLPLPTVPEYPDNDWLIFNDTNNSTKDVPINDYEPVCLMIESITNERPVSAVEDTVDLFMLVRDSNSTLQHGYISTSYSAIYANDTWSGVVNNSYEFYEPFLDSCKNTNLFFNDTYNDTDIN